MIFIYLFIIIDDFINNNNNNNKTIFFLFVYLYELVDRSQSMQTCNLGG